MKEFIIILVFMFKIGCSNEAKMNSVERASKQSTSSDAVVVETSTVIEKEPELIKEEPKVVEEEPVVLEEKPKEEAKAVEEEEPKEEPKVVEEETKEEPMTVQCDQGESLVNGVCIVSEFSECTEFVELNITTIPSLEKTGKCYYKKIVSAVATTPSGIGFEQASDVTAARHGNSPVPTGHPWVLGDYMETFIFDIGEDESKRSISLSGDFVADVEQLANYPVKIDNFLLIEIEPNNGNVSRFARGTGDSVPGGAFITVNNENVTDFVSYAGGGIATIDILDLSTSFERGVPTNIRIRMLDAGGSASASDLYLIIH
ncbi:MAG: hypothetical protein AB8G05_17225 [Oligoflexales bacterium]